jgi:hypothetical protein
MTEDSMEPKRKTRAHGETWTRARRMYIRYPLVPASVLALVLNISKQRFAECTLDLREEWERKRDAALDKLRAEL